MMYDSVAEAQKVQSARKASSFSDSLGARQWLLQVGAHEAVLPPEIRQRQELYSHNL